MCTKCFHEPHDPISCENLLEWKKACRELSENPSMQWIMFNTKDCPNCYVTIERENGCDVPSLLKRKQEQAMEEPIISAEVDDSMIFQCSLNSQHIFAMVSLPLILIGLVLTGISIVVYTRPEQRKTTIGYLFAFLSFFEFSFLFFALPSFSIAYLPSLTCSTEYPKYKSYIIVYIYPLTHVTKYMCVCISILISLQQWIAVFFPMQVRELCSMTRTRWALLFSFFLSIFLSIPKFGERVINPYNGRPVTNKTWTESSFIEVINYFDDNVFNAFIIFSILLFINISIIALLKYSQFVRMRMTSQSARDRRTTIMLIFVLLAYVGTHSPSMLIEYLDENLTTQLPQEISILRKEISNFCMCLHPIFSFIDYLIFSEKYKATVKSLFMRLPKGTSSNNPPQAV
ncbi:unnamed protein product [Caenorhabditis nigoni]